MTSPFLNPESSMTIRTSFKGRLQAAKIRFSSSTVTMRVPGQDFDRFYSWRFTNELPVAGFADRVGALRFFFVKTLKRRRFRDFLPYPQDRRRLPTVLSREEVSRLINAAGTLFP